MSRPEHDPKPTERESVHEEYVLGVRIVERVPRGGDDPRYRFEAPEHEPIGFETAEEAELYADVYFDVNGFEEAGTGERGIPPAIVQAGKDTIAAYLLTQPEVDVNWVASFFGRTPDDVERYLSWVRGRAREIREGAVERGIA